MQPGSNQPNVYGLRCIRCGSALELPADASAVYCDCRFCGQDNVLPPEVVALRQQQYEAQQRQYELDTERQARERADAERTAARRDKSKTLLYVLAGGAFLGIGLLGTCVAFGVYAAREDAAQKRRDADPTISGRAAILASIQKMRSEKGCDRILVQPDTYHGKPGTLSLDMVAGDHCVHLLAATGTGAPITMRYTTTTALKQPIPAPGTSLDYRLCASETATHTFEYTMVDEPFTLAAIECPRLPSEGGSRAKPGDPLKTGKAGIDQRLAELTAAGCGHLLADTTISRGDESFTLTSPANGDCYNFLVGSYFTDVAFTALLTDPNGNTMPVPDPAREMRVLYCPVKAGEYKLRITPSTMDHYAYASLDCPRNGAEGLRRERELRARRLRLAKKK